MYFNSVNARSVADTEDSALVLPNSTKQLSTARLHQALDRILQSSEAKTTRRTRDQLWKRYQTWASSRALNSNDDKTAMLFALQHAQKASSKTTYFNNLRARLHPRDTTAQFLTGLRRIAAAEGIDHAPVTTWATFRCILLPKLPPSTQAIVILAYRTASRMSDMAMLRRNNITLTNDNKIVIHWTNTKTSDQNPYKGQFYTEVAPPLPEATTSMPEHMLVMQYLHSLLPHAQVCPQSELSKIASELEKIGLSWHSIKRSAITAAASRAARSNIPLEVVARLAKHASTESTIRYIGDPPTVASLLQTGSLTQLC